MENLNDTAVFTTKFVIEQNQTITYVTRDLDDGAWQFFSDDKFDDYEKVAKIVGLNEIMEMDSSLNDLRNMELGNVATRQNKSDVWRIKKVD